MIGRELVWVKVFAIHCCFYQCPCIVELCIAKFRRILYIINNRWMACFECGLISFSSCILFPLSFFSLFWPDSSSFLSQKSESTAKSYPTTIKSSMCVLILYTLLPFSFCCLSCVGSCRTVQPGWINWTFSCNGKLIFLVAGNFLLDQEVDVTHPEAR